RIDIQQIGILGGGVELPGLYKWGKLGGRNIWNIALPPVKEIYLLGTEVKPGDIEPCFSKGNRQGQTHIAESDNSNLGCPVFQTFEQLLFVHIWTVIHVFLPCFESRPAEYNAKWNQG